MKRKTNIRIRNNKGIYITSNLILGSNNQYSSGDILDANATQKKINDIVSEATAKFRITNIKLVDNQTYTLQQIIAKGSTSFGECNGAVINLTKADPVTNVLIFYDKDSLKVRNALFVLNGKSITITTNDWGFEVKKIVCISKNETAEFFFTW